MELRTVFRRPMPPSVTVGVGMTTEDKKAPMIFIEEGVKGNQAVFQHLISKKDNKQNSRTRGDPSPMDFWI
ncbi:Hypothetical protein FKW44_011499 [Caligus rogercresseyi]|uniref:Uncharacterized protein n=1 Tax=Caligus rogercresseyi TaxID=217165 RepID=A0A7T8KAC5_CALRO|nr:Hypothetical protein FKW44_011499 [Caligus rogercresseyi]